MDQVQDIYSKNAADLRHLLHCQENLLQNKKFVQKLPDKGEKLYRFVDKIREALKTKELTEINTTLFSHLKITPHEDIPDIRNLLPGQGEKVVVDERTNADDTPKSVQKLLRTEQNGAASKKFHPNRSLKDQDTQLAEASFSRDVVSSLEADSERLDHVEGTDPDSRTESSASLQTCNSKVSRQFPVVKQGQPKKLLDARSTGENNPRLKYRYDESLEHVEYGPPEKFQKAKLISLQESMKAMQEHETKLQKLTLEQAARYLVHPRSEAIPAAEPINLEGQAFTRYREDEDSSTESDSVDFDYPD